jgi:hypothetical protein
MGTGTLTMRTVCIASGMNGLDGPAVSSGIFNIALNSGTFQRVSLASATNQFATQVRVDFAVDTGPLVIDGVQLEKGVLTDYANNFIGDFILPRRPNKLSITMFDGDGGGTIPAFTGITETLEPDLKRDTIHIHSYDFGNELQNVKALTTTSTGARMYTNIRSDVMLRHLAGMGGLASDDYLFDTGKNTIPFFWIQEGSVWFYMAQVAEAEGGRIFFDENGVLNFWNRDHIDGHSDSKFTFSMENDILEYSYRIDKDEIRNHIIVKTSPREVQANQPVYTNNTAIEVLPTESYDVWGQLEDPVISADEPTSSSTTASYWRANTAMDGSGSDVSALFSISGWYVLAKDIKFTLTNNSGVTAYITKILINGDPAQVINNITEEALDQESIDLYGEQVLQIENDYILTNSYAKNLATDKLFNLKNPRDNVLMHVVGVPYLQIGDVVTVPEGFDDKTKNLFIKKKRWQINAEGEYIEYIDLLSKTIASFFKLDESKLDGTDVLSE